MLYSSVGVFCNIYSCYDNILYVSGICIEIQEMSVRQDNVITARSAQQRRQSRSAKCIHGGAAFIVPLIQEYSFLDLRRYP